MGQRGLAALARSLFLFITEANQLSRKILRIFYSFKMRKSVPIRLTVEHDVTSSGHHGRHQNAAVWMQTQPPVIE